jgi:hypothetical protein
MLAEEIIRTNQLVEDSKNKAIFHAIECGAALIEAKALCKHGEWGVWLRNNCSVSERTTQVYMKLANEYPLLEDSNTQRVADLSIREAVKLLSTPKDATCSHHDWLPKGESLLFCYFESLESLFIQESAYSGFYYVVYVGANHIDYTIKPIPSVHVDRVIFDWLPGKRTRGVEIKHLSWETQASKVDFVKELISDFLPDDYRHLKNQDDKLAA